jgi:hypothetical protein
MQLQKYRREFSSDPKIRNMDDFSINVVILPFLPLIVEHLPYFSHDIETFDPR